MTDYYNGLFWENEAKEDSVKCFPPKRTWEASDYLIHYEEASAAKYDLISDANLAFGARFRDQKLIVDVESYRNYFCVCFKCVVTKKVMYFEKTDSKPLDIKKLRWVMENYILVTFNGKFYDEAVLFIALAGANCEELKQASDELIQGAMKPREVLKLHEVTRFRLNHIDLKEVAPGVMISLKLYGGRLEAMASTYVAYNNIHHDRSVEPYPGIHDALDALRARVPAAPFAIVTSKNRGAMLRGLQVCRLERYFDVCVTVDDVQRFKPHPEPVRTALDQLSVDPTATVFIGDSPHDMAAGRAAGVRTAAALWGPFAKESLAEQAPDFWLPHPRDIEHLGNHP